MQFRKIITTDRSRRKTRIVYGSTDVRLNTPLEEIIDRMRNSLSQILPEQTLRIEGLLESGIHIEIDNSRDDFRVAANVKDKLVVFGVPALERVWAYIWFYLEVFDLLQRYDKGVEIDFRKEPAIAAGGCAL
jgi:hypothetical protein